jgi:NAD(P)-dependent dehydrogenase (short-subunit alcohol dehydrogenase family)
MGIAIITGGSRGLGRSMALHLAERGIDIILTYRNQQTQAEEVVHEIENKGRKAVALALDVSHSETFAAFAGTAKAALEATWGRKDFDFLVNNAGIGINAPFMETREDQFDQVMNIHLKGPFFLSQKLLPFMRDGGRVLNISSGLTRFSMPGYSAYASMKGAMEVLTRYMASELGPRRISVNILAPGAIETDFGGGQVRDNERLNAFVASNTALGRAGLPEDIGQAAAMLLSDESGWINGQRVEASGGMFI